MLRKRGRAVECTGLENRQGRESFVSSNLTASANYILLAILAIQNKKISININNMHKRRTFQIIGQIELKNPV